MKAKEFDPKSEDRRASDWKCPACGEWHAAPAWQVASNVVACIHDDNKHWTWGEILKISVTS